jgi:hypothetical protein
MKSDLRFGHRCVNISVSHPASFEVTAEHGAPVIAIDGLRPLVFGISSKHLRFSGH